MNFLYPGFLFALLAIAIPIAIHLFNFRKFKKVYFSNVQFLKEAKEQNSSREKLKHLLVLISRILAVVFLVLAFARPFIPLSAAGDSGKRNLISIYIDNSYSMETVNKEGSLLDEAKRKAKEIAGAYQLNDQFLLLSNDFEGKHQRAVNKEEFIQLLDELKISSAGRSLQQVINRLQRESGTNRNQIAYLLSDFQKSFVGIQPVQADKDIRYSLIKLNANSLPNISVDSVWSLSPVHQPNQAEQLVVQLHNYGEEDAADIPIKLTINNQQKAISNTKVAAGKSVKDTLSFSGLQKGWQKGVLSIKDFPLTFDDALNFSFQVNTEMKVLNISGDPSQKFISSLFAADPYFKLSEMPEANIKYSSFGEYSLIVLSGLKQPSSGLAQQLKSYVQNGGSVVIFPDLDANGVVYTPFLTALSLPAVKQLNSGPAITSSIELKDPVFKDVFDQVPANMDLPVVTRYFSYLERNAGGKQGILQLPLGQFLFARYPAGAGKIYLSASSLDPKDGNLSRHPVFVPMMYKIAFSSVKEQPLYYTSGESDLLEHQKISLGANQSLTLKSDGAEVIPEVRQTPGKTLLYIADQVRKPGFYDLKKADSVLAVVAFNDNRKESDMHYASDQNLTDLFGKQKIALYNSQKDALSLNIQAKNNSIELWKLCLILAVVFLAIEILLIRFFNKTKNIQTP
ncbi:vWA domain-containing protein [Pedobacter caeni]|uniref:N-terminal double-transmembrane domain-containing protein n=1 Tax=Pedobacter caeni TaxID=288992 RepID=A0A1M4ZXM6_9SPHI|nr:VWA domain-containing protein [Pedobacter caeni]SHF22396.1 N-terminal double-transmembrane domain-containing protein [Pedobacter caeni]